MSPGRARGADDTGENHSERAVPRVRHVEPRGRARWHDEKDDQLEGNIPLVPDVVHVPGGFHETGTREVQDRRAIRVVPVVLGGDARLDRHEGRTWMRMPAR